MLNRLRKEQEGLTLIELIVVVAIIGVLAWLITPRVLEALNNSKLQSAVAVATELQSGLERYATDYDAKYPVTAAADTWGELTGVLGSYVTIAQNDTSNILLDANPLTTDTDYVATPGTATTPSTFCFVIQARDRQNTYIKVEETGISTDSAGALNCP